MNPAIRWLNGCDKLFLLDSESYSLYHVRDKTTQFDVEMVHCCPTTYLAGLKQEQDSVRSFALDHSPDNRLAIGYSSGRISIIQADIDPNLKHRGEDIREAQRSIAFLDWNYSDPSRLGAIYERGGRGAEHAVVVYDLNRCMRTAREIPMTVYESNFSEKLFGLSWFKEDPNLLLVSGTSSIRIADIREHGNFHNSLSIQTPLMGVCTEPNQGYRFACYSRNSVFVYDRRYLSSSPLHQVEACSNAKILNKLAWHPRRQFHLSALAKDSGSLTHLSISPGAFHNQQNFANQTIDPSSNIYNQLDQVNGDQHSYAAHFYSIHGTTKLIAFDWHSMVSQRLALLSGQENRSGHSVTTKNLHIINLREGISCDIGAIGDIATACGQRLKLEDIEKLSEGTEGMGLAGTFSRRIKAGYGYGSTMSPLSTLIENSRKVIRADRSASEDLHFCWKWLWMMFQSADALDVQKNYGTLFVGIKQILRFSDSNSTRTIKQDDITYRNRIFVNEKRLKILRICNWPNHANREECKARFDDIAERGGVQGITRAAALALFSVQGSLSKEYLTRLSEYTHSHEFTEAGHHPDFVAAYQNMAETVLHVLQNYDGLRVPDYEHVCGQLERDAYLLAIVKFLARRDKPYNKIYNEIFESNLKLEDKLAIGAIHMDDEVLAMALDKLIRMLLTQRPLSALLIVGLDDRPESHQVLHRFLDNTGDFQTVALLLTIGDCFRGCPSFQDNSLVGTKAAELLEIMIASEEWASVRRRSLHCFRDYIDLLNRWKFWLPKTFLCSFLRPKPISSTDDGNSRPKMMAIQAVIACNFCGSPIYPTIAERIENLRVHTPKISPFPRRLGTNTRTRTMSCLCRKPLPKCLICRKHLGSQMEPEAGGLEQQRYNEGNGTGTNSVIDHWAVWCSSCNHGGHLAHVRDWFGEYPVCAASGCDCQCVRRDHQLREELLLSLPLSDERAAAEEEQSHIGR